MRLLCMILGHRPLRVFLKRGILQTIKDQNGTPLLDIMLCERCRLLYWTSHRVGPDRKADS